ncbi:MAG TPA: VWA domain-containing protein [Sandaracinaceae bacterium LLY-WYZ-13_1]|nr:VWA domain-containing protein [Sandaracinaceae bacterium LLY-WYZ-13_1]
MSELDLTVGWPLALWGLLAIPLLVLAALRSRFPIGPRRRWMVVAARVLAAALVVAAVADLRLGWPTDELAVASVVDGSASVAEADRARVREQLDLLAAEHDDVAWIDATSPDARRPATDVSVAVAMLPRDRVRRMVVATDGRDRGGELGAAIAAAHRAGVEVSVAPMGDDPPVDLVSVRGVQVPRMVRAGDRLDVGVELHASQDANVELALAIDGAEVARSEAVATRGDSATHLPVRFPEEEGVHELTVALSAGGDPNGENDVWRSLVRVSPKPRVRILHDPENGRPALATVLDEAGMRVEVSPIIGAPSSVAELEDVNLVIVDEADPNDLTETQQQALRTWVEDEGGGLITVTGTHAVRRAPRLFREIEPITIPPAIPEPRPLELVLVIDRSSSMSGIKMMQARNAGVAAIRALRDDARAGVVAFSGGADRVMAPVGMDQREDAVSFTQGIHASGGTNIGAALTAANAVMSNDPRYIHHVILLSDGVSSPEPALAAARVLAGRGVSISAITIGPRNDLMAQIAQIGRGRYHVTNNAGSLPSLFVREAQYRQPPAHRRGTFTPRVDTHLAMLDGVPLDEAPPLTGYALSGLERGATQVLSTPDRRPLLAHWHRGLGQVATFTSATTGSWADRWREWRGFRELWVAMAEGMLRTRPVEPPQLRLRPHPLVDGVQILTVLGPTLASTPEPIVRVFREAGEGRPLELIERGPGVWQTELAAEGGFLVDARMPGDERPTVAVGHDHPYDPELAVFGRDAAELARLAAAGGGRVLERPAQLVEAVEEEAVMRSLRTPLLAAALVLYLLGLLLLRLPDHSVGAMVVRPERKRRRWGSRRRSMHPEPPSETKEAA